MNLSVSSHVFLLSVCIAVSSSLLRAQNQTVNLQASLDTAIFANSGSLSSGQGILTTGRTGTNGARRALVAFDLAKSIPAGSKIVSVTLAMSTTKVSSTTQVLTSLHRVTTAWGEGTSNSSTGAGAAATTGDATWTDSVWQKARWTTAGGDFNATASATAKTGVVARYQWLSTAALVADAQQMLDSPATNFGWLLLTTETGRTARLWASREHATASQRPVLQVVYQPVVASVVSSGKGCAAAGRTLDHTAAGLPKVGNATFALKAANGPSAGLAILYLAAGLQNPPIALNSNKCFLYLNILALGPSFGGVFSNSGSTNFPFPIPNNAGLTGIVFDTQIFSIGPGFTLRSSNALTMKVGN